MDNRFAVIDLGTNTFHLLAVELMEDGHINRLYKERIYVKLAEEGIGRIGDGAFKRGKDAITKFKGIMDDLGVSQVRAFGTAALRTASNGSDFAREIEKETGVVIDIISGKEEARLIHQGVMQAIRPMDKRIVIMDIGGGSVEFVIADHQKVYWSESFPIGVAVLYKQFHHNDPIQPGELSRIDDFLEVQLESFFKAMAQFKGEILIGASGTFDVLDIMMDKKKSIPTSSELVMDTFRPLYEQLIKTTYQQRIEMERIPNSRADMIIVALALIRFVLERTKISGIVVSAYAMKEGILKEMMEET